jgi:hypothetical protein
MSRMLKHRLRADNIRQKQSPRKEVVCSELNKHEHPFFR